MFDFSIKSALVAFTLLGATSTASAADVFTEALALTEGQSRAVNQSNYVKLSESIDMVDAKSIDAAITSKYGAPAITRSGLKVWEVENTDGSTGSADKVTITCGMEDGRIQISIDARTPTKAPRRARKSMQAVPVSAQFKASKAKKKAKATSKKPQSNGRLALRPQNSDR